MDPTWACGLDCPIQIEHCRTVGRTVGLSELSDMRETVEDSRSHVVTQIYCRTPVGLSDTVGLSDCRTVGLSEYCRIVGILSDTVGLYCRTVGPGLKAALGLFEEYSCTSCKLCPPILSDPLSATPSGPPPTPPSRPVPARPDRPEPSRTVPYRPEPSRAVPSRPEPSRAVPSEAVRSGDAYGAFALW
jgi:hypothetical protein